MEDRHRITVAFGESAYEVLEDLAKRSGRKKGDVLRDALYLEKRAQEAWANEGRVLIEEGKTTREVIRR